MTTARVFKNGRSRMAWLRPFLKTLAVVIGNGIYHMIYSISRKMVLFPVPYNFSDLLLIYSLEHVVLVSTIGIYNRNAVPAESGADRRPLAFPQIFEIQVTHQARGMHDGDGDSRLFGGWISSGQALAAGAKEFHAANRCQRHRDAVHTITDVR